MDLKRLEVFCRVVELKSFSKAAEEVLLSQPTVSEHIRILEETFGEKLLDRMNRQALVTPAGRVLYQYARRLLRLQDEAVQAMAGFRGDFTGSLTLGASTIPGAYVLPDLIESFRTLHPSIRMMLKISGSGKIARELAEGETEMAVVGALWKDQRLESREIYSDRLVLAVAPDHPWAGRSEITPEELLGEPFILREEESGTRLVTARALSEVGLEMSQLTVAAEMGSSEAARQGIKAGLGVSFLSSLSVAEDVQNRALVLVTVRGLDIERPFYLVQRKNRSLSPLGAAFLDHLLQVRIS